jgi:pimeloyl-ACP methyl ester carboxylesterase
MPRVDVNGLTLKVQVDGDGKTVLLLHGAPDSAALWRHVAPRLTSAGYQTVAPDQRGFGGSDAPRGVKRYAMDHLASDALTVMDTLGIERAHLVGHDWGAAVGWVLAGRHPERFRTFTAISLGHARAYAAAGFEQLRKAWYIALVLVPWLGERLVRGNDWRLLRRMTGHPEVDRWVADLGRDGRLTAGMNWYRANALAVTDHPKVKVPVLGLWSDGDFALTEAQMTGSAKYVEGPWRYERIEGASHWLPLDAPDQVAALLLEFFRDASPATA